MQYLRVENPIAVVPSMEMLRTLGASSSRGHGEKIGQFGSGTPNAFAELAREGLWERLKICLGKDVYTGTTKTSTALTSEGKEFIIEELILKKANGPSVNLNIATQFGALDWTNIGMALREFISNAIDGCDGPKQVKIEFVEESQCRAKDGTIRVYVPATQDVREYVSQLHVHFLCLRPGYQAEQRIIPNAPNEPSRVYRKGVLVGSFGKEGLFSYNLPEIRVDESRTVDSCHAENMANETLLMAETKDIAHFLKSWDSKQTFWEHHLGYFSIEMVSHRHQDRVRQNWQAAYSQVFGDAVLCETPTLAHIVKEKGYSVKLFENHIGTCLRELGIRSSRDILTKDEIEGRDIVPATEDVIACRDRLWKLLEDHGLTNGRTKPDVFCFRNITKAEGTTLGVCRSQQQDVGISLDIANRSPMLTKVMLEELAHHITKASDFSRDFQDFAFRLAALMTEYLI